MKKRFCAIILSLLTILSFALFVNVNEAEASDTIKIYSEEDLYNVRNDLTANYILMKDIIFEDEDFAEGGKYYNNGSGWLSGGSFEGVFDGNGYSIQNISGTLFSTNYGTIKNLGIIDVSTISEYYPAGLCKDNYGLIDGCYVTGSVGGSATDYAGGIVYSNRDTGVIQNSYNIAKVTGKEIAGIATNNWGVIDKCYNAGYIYAYHRNYRSGSWVGGITARNYSVITNCFNSGTIYPYLPGWYSGITALNQAPTSGDNPNYISNCYNSGDLSSANTTGGIVALNYNSSSTKFTNCYYIDRYNVSYGIYSGNAGVQTNVSRITRDDMTKKVSFVGFDFKNVWKFDTSTGYNYPILRSVKYDGVNTTAVADVDYEQYMVAKVLTTPVYNGSAQEPEVFVSYKNQVLTKDVDYTVTYANNVEAGSKAEFTIVGCGVYEDVKMSDTFTILKADMSKADVRVDSSQVYYTGAPVKPTVYVYYNEVQLAEGTDYQLQYYNNVASGVDAVVRVIGLGNYRGAVEEKFAIIKGSVETIDSAIVLGDCDDIEKIIAKDSRVTFTFEEEFNYFSIYYEGQLIKTYWSYEELSDLTMTFAYAGDWKLTYSYIYYETDVSINNGRPSYSTSKYYGSCVCNVKSVSDTAAESSSLEAAYPYGTEMRYSYLNYETEFTTENLTAATWTSSDPTIASVDETGKLTYKKYGDAVITAAIGDNSVKYDVSTEALDLAANGTLVSYDVNTKKAVVVFAGETLKQGTDYTLTVTDKTAYYSVVVKGKGMYSGKLTGLFSKTDGTPFKRIALDANDVKLAYASKVYTGSALTPKVSISGLEKDVDYTVTYKNNINAGTAKVVVTGIGEYKGTVTKTFTIKAKSAANLTAKLSYMKTTYSGSAKTPNVTVKNGSTKLVKGTDYTVSFSKTTRKAVGKYAITITFKGNYSGTKKLTYYILPGKTSSITPTCKPASIKATWKAVTGATGYKVQLISAKGTVLKTKDTTNLYYNFTNLSKLTTYKIKVTAYKTINNEKIHSLVSRTITTSTSPAKVTAKKVTAGTLNATVTWDKVAGSGYEVVYSTSKDFSTKSSVLVTKSTTLKKKITGLKKAKTYYFKVRAYRTVGDKKVYGAYSNVISVKIK